MTCVVRLLLALVSIVCTAGRTLGAESPAVMQTKADFFEQRIRPLLLEHCGECHIENQSGGLSLMSRQTLLQGGDSGVVVIPGDAAQSPLLAAVLRTTSSPMPPEEKLGAEETAAIKAWIEAGAVWTDPLSTETTRDAAHHWAFQPVEDVTPPTVRHTAWCRTTIDPFVLHALEQAGLQPSEEVSRGEWLRRATYALTGLPPTFAEIKSFTDTEDAESYEQAVQRLMNSPSYGQHQARMWLDLARYSDTKGYVYAREERFWLHAWNYRDWVVDALNGDIPYDRFLLLQIAADQVLDRQPQDLAAMGFLTLGRRFLGVKHDIIDDRIDVVCRGTMAMTVGCARCHDHKFDPIPTSDYYALYGVFDSSSEHIEPLSPRQQSASSDVEEKRRTVQSTLDARRAEQAKRVRDRLADYLWAQTELQKYPADGFDQIFAKTDLLPSFVRRFQSYLRDAERSKDRVFVAWRAYRELSPKDFGIEAVEVTARLRSGKFGPVHPDVLAALESAPETLREVADRYGILFREFEQQLPSDSVEATKDSVAPEAIVNDMDAMELWRVLFAEEGPCQVPNRSIVHTESFFDSDTCNELWKVQGEFERAIIAAGNDARYAIALTDNPKPKDARVFRRGNPLDQGAEVPRRFLTSLSGPSQEPFEHGSGRLELAQRIIDPTNPLTARVIVNRVWAQHFGQGLVATPSDFGLRAAPPSHPELLDYLARKFIADGWSLKSLHQELLLSATYRQNSQGPSQPTIVDKAKELDPENRLLWRMNPHRLTFEELRDSLLDSCGHIDDSFGGPATPILKAPFSTRRTLYGLIDRQFLPSSFRVFDFASPDLHIPARNETIIPQQALFLMNHPMVLDQVTRMADQLDSIADVNVQIDTLFRRVLRRHPTESERTDSLDFLSNSETVSSPIPPRTVVDWQYGYGSVDESSQRVQGFTPLPHFTGETWQGGDQYPDATLGWAQLSAVGGHPGNDRQHACVRRWVSPRDMQLRIRSLLRHEAAPGDGVRAFVVSDRNGILRTERVHQRDCDVNIESLGVREGETIDFVVDIDEILNNDQFLWSVTIETLDNESAATTWDSHRDFTPETPRQLSPLAQLAQILLCTNEFTFVD